MAAPPPVDAYYRDNSLPFAIIQGDEISGGKLLVLYGQMQEFNKLTDIPRHSGPTSEVTFDTVSMIPFSQISERGYKAHNHGEKILTLKVSKWYFITSEEFCNTVADEQIDLEQVAGREPLHYDTTRDEYAKIIEIVKHQMIGCGEGSSFVTPRKCSGKILNFTKNKALTVFRRLTDHYGCYWKFMFYDGKGKYFIGASPERHLTVRNNKVEMNPISGTFRKEPDHSPAQAKAALIKFLRDEKEIDELWMVADEELKMMAAMCTSGGDVLGPLVKEMGALVHTEYLLCGKHDGTDLIDLFRNSMFAPTVTGSPMGNACACVYTLEKDTRSYYSSAIMVLGREKGATAKEFLDSSITIRTVEILADGSLDIRVGATLVKDSVPMEEVLETEGKIRGVIHSLSTHVKPPVTLEFNKDPEILAELTKRNSRLSRFWLERQDKSATVSPFLKGKKVVVMNNEDDFAMMLTYMLRCMGLIVKVYNFDEFVKPAIVQEACDADLALVGPGPGDPTNLKCEKMNIVRRVIAALQKCNKKILYVCLGHQIMCHLLGFEVWKKAVPTQGVQKECLLFGKTQKLGFYNAFYAKHDPAREASCGFIQASAIPASNGQELIGIRHKDFISFQFHPESILTQNGFDIVQDAIRELLGDKALASSASSTTPESPNAKRAKTN